MNAAPEKTEMSAQEASWHELVAGKRARHAAKLQGAHPLAVEAIGTATAGPRQIGPFTVHPATEGTVWTLRRIAREFRAWADALGMPMAAEGKPDGTREMMELGLTTLVFMDSLRVWRELDAGQLEPLIFEAEDLFWSVPGAVHRELEEHFRKQMDAIRELGGEPAAEKKSHDEPAESGISQEMPSPQPDTPLPASSGCAPSTEPVSPMPCGGSLW